MMTQVLEAPTELPFDPFVPMENIHTGPRTIISVYPVEMSKEVRLGRGLITLKISAASRNSYSKLMVSDSFQRISDTTGLGEDKTNATLRPAPVTGAVIADSLVRDWTASMGNGAPGIGVMPVGVIEGTPAFSSFVQGLISQQKEMCDTFIQDANDKFIKGESNKITPIYRILAEWQYGDEARGLPWYTKKTVQGNKKCIGCRKDIDGGALTCEHCNLDLVDYYLKYDIDPGTDAVVDGFVAKLKAKSRNVVLPQPNSLLNPNDAVQPEGALRGQPVKPTAFASKALTEKVLAKMTDTEKTRFHQMPTDAKRAELITKLASAQGITED